MAEVQIRLGRVHIYFDDAAEYKTALEEARKDFKAPTGTGAKAHSAIFVVHGDWFLIDSTIFNAPLGYAMWETAGQAAMEM